MTRGGTAQPIPRFTFGINQELPSLDSGWKPFPGHYLLYARSGVFTLEVADRQWLLPPQRAAWVAADVPIRIQARAAVISSSILFAADSIPRPPFDCRVFAVTPLAREMILYSMRWGIECDPKDTAAEQFFAAVASVCTELAATPEQFWLPRAQSEDVSHAMDYIVSHVASRLRVEDIAQAINVSSRTLARRFIEEAHLTCGQCIRRVRMVRAMELLAQHDAPITEVAYAVGFESSSAFNAAFRQFAQETPTQYRKRFLPS